MTIQRKHGQWGEDIAVNLILKEGYDLVERNWRYKRAEVDIIARDGDVLVFIEVKTRASPDFGRPEAMVNVRKRRFLIDAAMGYMRYINHDWEIRFDIIAIIGEPETTFEITHFRDAFFPGLDYTG